MFCLYSTIKYHTINAGPVRYPLSVLVLAAAVAFPASNGIAAQENQNVGTVEQGDIVATESNQAVRPTSDSGTSMQPTAVSIKQFEKRVERNPADHGSWIILGRLHLRHAREEDAIGSYKDAEHAFRRALAIQPESSSALLNLSNALHAQHQFSESLEMASRAHKIEPENLSAIIAVGDAQMELGKLDDAEESFNKAAARSDAAAILIRQAHLSEIRGRSTEALEIAESARRSAVQQGQEAKALSWYDMRIGVMHLHKGQFEDAEKNLKLSLKNDPQRAISLIYLANVKAATGDIETAIELTQDAIKISPEPPSHALLGDLLVLSGQKEKAEHHYDIAQKAMEEEADILEQAHLRERARFYLNHDRKLTLALELAKKDIAIRQDVYSWDTLAWALYKNNQPDEAWKSIERALAAGTQDAELFYHAGLIKSRLGDSSEAATLFKKSLEISPWFSPIKSADLKKRMETQPTAAKADLKKVVKLK